MRSRTLTAAALATALSAAGVLATAQSAVAAPQSSCDYKVVWPTAGVYENPSPYSVIVKTKQAGDIVGAPGPGCEYAGWNDATYNYTYARVSTDAAADGVGWMRYDALVRV
ncbi:glycosyltransferase [Streptomyces sp. RKAG290]|uniref:glycosyltransferase n=1 Tax=Streptomyces sp. RKAG290 TaxID=2888348 RepID=UPI00203453F4|nr:glycosyltransferase [Streptomyces sp. RKAG290]MCM2415985.1 glycosyltransferase [Streptomyces sp. RKAG290]